MALAIVSTQVVTGALPASAVVPGHGVIELDTGLGTGALDAVRARLPIRIYVPLTGEDAVAVLNEATGAVVATIPLGGRPFGVALHPDGSRVYVTAAAGVEADGFVISIDTATNTILSASPVGRRPTGIAVHPAGTRVYVANFDSSSVSVLDPAGGTFIATIDVAASPLGIAVSRDGGRVFVTHPGPGAQAGSTITVIDSATNAVEATLAVADAPTAIVASPAEPRVFVTHHTTPGVLSAIDTASLEVASVQVGAHPYGIAIDERGTSLYVISRDDGVLLEIATDRMGAPGDPVVTATDVGLGAETLGLVPGGSLYITRRGTETLSVVAETVAETSPIGKWPFAFGQFIAVIPASIAGRVTRADGLTPIADAMVMAWPADAGAPVATTLTAVDGSYLLSGLAPGGYTVEARKEGFTLQRSAPLAVAGARGPIGIDFALADEGADSVGVAFGGPVAKSPASELASSRTNAASPSVIDTSAAGGDAPTPAGSPPPSGDEGLSIDPVPQATARAQALASGLTITDDFEAPIIDETTWIDRELVRRIVGGEFESGIRQVGAAASNFHQFLDETVNPFANHSTQADVRVAAASVSGARSRSRVVVRLYNDRTTSGTDQTGDITAEIGIELRAATGLRGFSLIFRCESADCGATTTLHFRTDLFSPGPLDSTHVTRIDWDAAARAVTFTFDGTSLTVPLNIETFPVVGPPRLPLRSVGTRVDLLTDATSGGSITAFFDNVVKDGVPYDDFSSSLIDRARWKTWELVREVAGGTYRSAVRRVGANGSNDLTVIGPESIHALQADVTITAVSNNPLAPTSPGARLVAALYNTGDPGPGRVGDVLAGVGIRHDGVGLRGFYFVVKCIAANCNLPGEQQVLEVEDTAFGFPELGETHRIGLAWDGVRVTFAFDGRVAVVEPTGIPGYAVSGPPRLSFKTLQTRVTGITTPTREGFVAASFDNAAAGHFVSGRVTTGDGVTPVAGATVILYDGATPLATTTSAANGTYTIIDVPTGTYKIGATAPGFGPGFFRGKPNLGSADSVVVAPGGAALGVDVALCGGGTLSRANTTRAVGAGLDSQFLGEIELHENCAGALAAGGDVRFTLPAGMSLVPGSIPQVLPLAAPESGGSSSWGGLEWGPVSVLDGGAGFGFTVVGSSTEAAGKLLIKGILVNVAAGAAVGPASTRVAGSAGVTPANVENAVVASGPALDPDLTVAIGQGAAGHTISITGANFAAGTSVCIGTLVAGACTPPAGVVIESVTIVSANELRVNLDVNATALAGAYDLHVIAPAGGAVIQEDGVIIAAAPTVTGTDRQNSTPLVARPDERMPHQLVKITGTGFQEPTNRLEVLLPPGSGITPKLDTLERLSSELIQLYVDVEAGAATVNQPITVVNPDGGPSAPTASAFVTVALAPAGLEAGGPAPKTTQSPPPPPPPSISNVSPSSAALGATVAINGASFSSTVSSNVVTFAGAGGTRVPATVVSATTGQLMAVVPAQAADGSVTVAVNGVLSNAVAFVLTNPRLVSVSPTNVTQGREVTLQLTGTKFAAGASVAFDPATGIIAQPAVVGTGGTSIQVPIAVTAGAALGPRAVTVSNPSGGGTSTLANAFEVKAPVAGALTFSLVGDGVDTATYLPSVAAVSVTLDATGKCTAKTVTPTSVTLQIRFVSDLVPAPAPPPSVAVTLASSALPGTATNEDCELTLPPANDWSIGSPDPAVQTATINETAPGSGIYEAALYSYDAGGTVTISAVATSNATVNGTFRIPVDADGDGLPDAYESMYEGTLDAQNGDQDGNGLPDGADRFARDGLSNFQKYRGVFLVGPANGRSGAMGLYMQLDADKRHLLARGRGWGTDPLLPPGSCGIDPLTGAGVPDESVTVLSPCPPFSIGPAFENRNVSVLDVTRSYTALTQVPVRSMANPTVGILDVATVVLDARNCSGSELCDQLGKIGIRQLASATLGFSTFGSATTYGNARVFWRAVKSYFQYRPYQHRTNDPTAVIIGTDGRPLLAPITLVADKNDNGVRDSKEKVDVAGQLLGDTYIAGSGNQALSATDANNDACVELPLVPDPRTIPVKCDPSAASATASHPSQATRRQVAESVATHELGHAAGINIHTAEPDDLMYQYTINWTRVSRFSDVAGSLIQVHNGGKQ